MALRNRSRLIARAFFGSALALSAALGSTTLTTDAQACGGLFCSNSNPVNQAAERIIFAKNGDGTVTAAIEILYQGPAHEFAWVLPVPPADVDVKVSSKQALDALQQASNPQYNLSTSFEEGCAVPDSAGAPGVTSPPQASAPDPSADGAVEVVASGSAGPYDYTQIAVNPSDDDPAQAAVDWLTENGFDVSAVGPDLLRPYLMQDMNLLAFKLSKGNEAGSIRPVLLRYPGEAPVIPIRPTAVAANDDMGILVWVLGDGRAVPTNFLHLELNEARIDWFTPNPTYNDVIIAAADEAGGKGFVTEQAGPAGGFADTIAPQWKLDEFTTLRTAQFDTMEQFLQMAQNVAASPFQASPTGFGGPLGDAGFSPGQNQYDGFIDILRDPTVVPLREGATPEQLNACVSCYFQVDVPVRNDLYPSTEFDPETDPLLQMDVGLFLDKMEELVIEPLRATRVMFEENSHVTRLYTTMSAEDMTEDPVFDLNAELEDVSNVHTANRILACDGNDWTIVLPSGVELHGTGNTWPIPLSDMDMPFNVRILQLSTSGEGDVLLDNTDAVIERLYDLGLSDVLPPAMDPEDPEDPADPEDPRDDVDIDETDPEETDPSPAPSEVDTEDPEEDSDPAVIEDDTVTMGTDDGTDARTSDGGCSVQSSTSPVSAWAWSSLLVGLGLFSRRRRHHR